MISPHLISSNLFSYNARSELTGAIMSTNTFSYAFDQIGNRLSASNNVDVWTYLCNALNQYTNITDGVTLNPTYDLDGNMATYNGWSYTWNGENRMVGASNGSTVVSYQYDYMGRMFSKVKNGAETKYVWDGYNIIAEVSSGTTNYNVWGLDLSQTFQGAGGVGGLLAIVTAADTDPEPVEGFYPCFDANGNITDYVDTNGVVVAHREFDPFGNTIVATGDKVNDFHFWFSSKYLDAETGLYYYGYRFYCSALGRFLKADPITELAFRVIRDPELVPAVGTMMAKRTTQVVQRQYSRNLYLLVHNDPVTGFDKLGLQAQTQKWKQCTPPLVWRQKGAGNVLPADGCSFPGWAQLLAKVAGKMPWSGNKDNPTGQCSFQWACNIHDMCYSHCDRSQGNCDNQLWNNLNTACNFCGQVMPDGPDKDEFKDLCNEWADIFLWAVTTFGGSAYKHRQKLNCECQCPMPPFTAPFGALETGQ